MDQNSDIQIKLYKKIIGDVKYNSPRTQAPGQKLAVSCSSDRTPFQSPISNKDRELSAHDLRPALGHYNELAEVSQVPQNPVYATRHASVPACRYVSVVWSAAWTLLRKVRAVYAPYLTQELHPSGHRRRRRCRCNMFALSAREYLVHNTITNVSIIRPQPALLHGSCCLVVRVVAVIDSTCT